MVEKYSETKKQFYNNKIYAPIQSFGEIIKLKNGNVLTIGGKETVFNKKALKHPLMTTSVITTFALLGQGVSVPKEVINTTKCWLYKY